MNCCGSKRQAFLPTSDRMPQNIPEKDLVFVKFRYTGQRGIAVTGGVTGNKYRFYHSGDEVLVDGRDAAGMGAVPDVVRSEW